MILKFDFQRDEVSFFFLLSHPTALSCIAGVDHGLQLKHRQSVLPPQIRQRWSVPSPRPPRCPVTFSASWYNAPSRNGQSRTSGRTSLPVFRLPTSGRSQAPACSGRGQPSARQLRTAACESVPDRRSHRCRAAFFFKRQFHRLVPPY